jgi:hypothetical protein
MKTRQELLAIIATRYAKASALVDKAVQQAIATDHSTLEVLMELLEGEPNEIISLALELYEGYRRMVTLIRELGK